MLKIYPNSFKLFDRLWVIVGRKWPFFVGVSVRTHDRNWELLK